MQSYLPGPTSGIQRRIFRWYIFLLTIVTVVIALATAWPRLKPTTYDENLNLPSWDALSTQLKTTPQRQRIPGYEREQFGSGWGRKGVCSLLQPPIIPLELRITAILSTPSQPHNLHRNAPENFQNQRI